AYDTQRGDRSCERPDDQSANCATPATPYRANRRACQTADNRTDGERFTERLETTLVEVVGGVPGCVVVLVQAWRIERMTAERISRDEPSDSWVHPPCAVVLEARVGIEGLAGEGVGLLIGSGVCEEFAEGVFSEPWGVLDHDHHHQPVSLLPGWGRREVLERLRLRQGRGRDRGLGAGR